MADGVLGMIGLAKRAGAVYAGDEPSAVACRTGAAKLIVLASDAGDSTARRAKANAAQAKIPVLTVNAGKEELGAAVGRGATAVLAVANAGLAAAIQAKMTV